MRVAGAVVILAFAAVLLAGTVRNPNFWRGADQRGDALFRAGRFQDAAKTYADPWRIGLAQYRNGDFEAAARTFARVGGAVGSYNSGNAWLMHGAYDQAIAAYDRALVFHPDWPEAQENRALAIARRDKIKAAAKTDVPQDEDEDEGNEKKMGENRKADPTLGEPISDEEIRADWLRQVQTTPGDFLRAKFAWQANHSEISPAPEKK